MNSNPIFIIQRLSDFYTRQNNNKTLVLFTSSGNAVEKLIGFQLLDVRDNDVFSIIKDLSGKLSLINIENAIFIVNNQPCLFIQVRDESTVYCYLKHLGIAIAESLKSDNYYCYI